MKKIVISLVVLLCSLMIATQVCLAKDESIEKPNIKIVCSGKQCVFHSAPIMDHERLYLPLKELLEALSIKTGAFYTVNKNDSSVTIRKDGTIIKYFQNTKTVSVNKNNMSLSEKPIIIKGMMYLSLADLSLGLKLHTAWDHSNNYVYICKEADYLKTKEILENSVHQMSNIQIYEQVYKISYNLNLTPNTNEDMPVVSTDAMLSYSTILIHPQTNKVGSEQQIHIIRDLKNKIMYKIGYSSLIPYDPKTATVTASYYNNGCLYSQQIITGDWVKNVVNPDTYSMNFKPGATLINNEILYCGLHVTNILNTKVILLKGDALAANVLTMIPPGSDKLDQYTLDTSSLEIEVDKDSAYILQYNFSASGKVVSKNGTTWQSNITYTNNNFDKDFQLGSISYYDSLIANKDKIIGTLDSANQFLARKDYQQALSTYDQVILLDSRNAIAYYNKACILSLQNKTQEAINSIKKAFQYCFYYKTYAETDHDLDNIRNLEEYKQLINQ